MFKFTPLLICLCRYRIINHFACKNYRRFKVHDLITCESKVQVVVSLGRYEVLFALGRHEDLTHDT